MSEAGGVDPVVAGYAQAIFAVAEAEGALERVEEELFRFARAMEDNPELRDRLVDPSVDAGAKLGVIADLLGERAHPQTVSAASYVVQAGRARQLSAIVDSFIERAAEARAHTVAEARSAVPLTNEQRRRLAQALGRLAGREVDLKVVVDPELVGGLRVRLGDSVIDGSVARRLADVRGQLSGA